MIWSWDASLFAQWPGRPGNVVDQLGHCVLQSPSFVSIVTFCTSVEKLDDVSKWRLDESVS